MCGRLNRLREQAKQVRCAMVMGQHSPPVARCHGHASNLALERACEGLEDVWMPGCRVIHYICRPRRVLRTPRPKRPRIAIHA